MTVTVRICGSSLMKLRKAPKPEDAGAMNKMMTEAAEKMGVKILQGFMTLGQYDSVWITEAPTSAAP